MLFRISKFFLYATVFCVVIVSTSTLFPFIVGKYAWFRSGVDLALIFFLLGLILDANAKRYLERLKAVLRSPLAVAISIFTLVFLLACFFGVRPHFSFWSNFERGEGGLQILHLCVFFLLLTTLFDEEAAWRRLFWCSIAAALLMIGYGVGAGLKYVDVKTATSVQNGQSVEQPLNDGGPLYHTFQGFVGPAFSTPGYRFQGSIGNPAYVATYLIFILFYVLYLFINRERKRGRGAWFTALGAIFLAFFVLAATRGAFVGLIAAIVAGLAYLAYAKKPLRKWLIGAAAGVVILVAIFVSLKDTPFVSRLPGARLLDLSTNTETFSWRRIMWHTAFTAAKDRPLLGYGPENFIKVFDRYFEPRYYKQGGVFEWYDRAHSLIFDALAETGFLGLLSYLGVFAVLFWGILRKKSNQAGLPPGQVAAASTILFIALPVAYLVQGLVLFDILPIYLNLFIFFAFACYRFWLRQDQGKKVPAGPNDSAVLTILSVAGILFASAALYFGSLLPLAKAQKFIQAEQKLQAGGIKSVRDFENNFDQVLQFSSPVGEEETPKFLGNDVLGIVSNPAQNEGTSRALVSYIEPYMQKGDLRHRMALGQMYAALYRHFGHVEDAKAAEDDFLAAHALGPSVPQPMYLLVGLYRDMKDDARMRAFEDQIRALWPDADPLAGM